MMRKIFLKLILLGASVLLMDFLLGKGLDYLQAHAKSGNTKRFDYIAHEMCADVVISGSSRCSLHYSPQVFEDSLESILGIYNAVEQELLGQVEDTGRSGAAPSAVSSGGENASEKDREQDYIHNAGKRDEKRSLIPGASIIGAGTIGQYLLGDDQDPAGDPAGTQRAGGGEGQNADQAADGAGTSQAAPAVTDLDDLTAVLFPIPVDPDRIFKKEDPWEDFLHFLPAWLVEMLPDFALEYLHELFDLFRNLTELFGDVRFLDAEDILICGIWGTFYTLLIWYFYQKAFPQDGDTIETKSEDIRPIDESAEDRDTSEEEQELVDGPGDEESTTEEDSNSVEDKVQDEETSENKQDSAEDRGQDEETSENKQGFRGGPGTGREHCGKRRRSRRGKRRRRRSGEFSFKDGRRYFR